MRDSRGKTLRAFTSNLARKQNDGEYEKMMRKTSRNDGEFMVRSNRMVNTSLVLYCAAVVERWSGEIVDLMKQLLRNSVSFFFFYCLLSLLCPLPHVRKRLLPEYIKCH